jgi:nitrate/nitrite transporter NarK
LAVAAVVTLAMVFGALTPLVVGALGPYLVPDLSLSRSQLGLFVTLSFVVATLASLPSGRLVDRVDSRIVVTAIFGISAAALLGLAAATTVAVFLVLAIPSGLVQAASNPVTNRLVALHTPLRQRGVVVGAKQAGVHVGGFAAGLGLPLVAAAAGWRASVALAAGVAVAVLWLSLDVVPRGATAAGPDLAESAPFRWRAGIVPYLTLYAFLMGGGVAAVTTYIPLYANERIGMGETAAGAVLAVFALTGVVARVAWGWIGDRVAGAAPVLGALGLASTLATLVLWHAESGPPWSVWAAAVGLGASAAAWNAVGMLAAVRDVDAAHVGRATGVVSAGFFAGFIVSPTAFGAVVDATGGYRPGWLAVAAHFAVAAGLSLWWWRRRDC